MNIKSLSNIYGELDLISFDLTLFDLEKTYKELEHEFDLPPSPNDVAWRILNRIVSTTNNLNLIGYAYRKMALIAEKEGKDHSDLLEQAHLFELKYLLSQGINEIEIENKHNWKKHTARNKICDTGRKLIGKKFPINEAIANKPIPTNCEKGARCICRYKATDNDDLRRFENDLNKILGI